MMRSFLGRYNYFLLLLLVFFIAELVVNPLGDFPLNDDWNYAKALFYSLNDHYTVGHFGAMTLFTHLAWGAMFVKVFGFSFTVLRFSTLLSAVIGMFFLDRLIFMITKNKLAAFGACLVLLFNPLYFNLTNTYMTDVNFNTLLVLCCYFAFTFFESRKLLPFILFFVFSTLLVLLRQFGIVLPFCFLAGCLFISEKRWLWCALALAGGLLVYWCFHAYENYLREILPPNAAYKYSGDVRPGAESFRTLLSKNFSGRCKVLFVSLFVYAAPLAAFYFIALIRGSKVIVALATVAVSSALYCWFAAGVEFPYHNVFENMWLGPETFYESLTTPAHNRSEGFAEFMIYIKFIFGSITFSTMILAVLQGIRLFRMQGGLAFTPGPVFLLGILCAYTLILLITESFFDRYFVPLVTVVLILLSITGRRHGGNLQPALLALAVLAYIAVFGTKDYLTWNRLRWEAYHYVKKTTGTDVNQINGGFEMNCWNDGRENWWAGYSEIDNYDYLIQFNAAPGFKLVKEYEFQRYFPYKKDKINIFGREVPRPRD